MSSLTLPSSARVPLALLSSALAIALGLSVTGGGSDAASATQRLGAMAVRSAASGPVGPGPQVDEELVASASVRGGRAAAAPNPTGALASEGAALLDALGVARSEPVTNADLLSGASALGVATGGWVREEHLAAMQQAFLQRARPAVVGLGVSSDQHVDAEEVRAAAATMGIDVGETVDPAEVVQVVELAPDFPGGPTPRLGVVAGINLRTPSRVPLMAGFHQASYANAVGIQMVDHPAAGVLPSRARGTAMTSAVDVRVPPGTTVLAPIRGTVVEVTRYDLYGKYPDVKIRMVPESDPTLLVTVLHVTDPLVGVGQKLEAGDPLARHATQFPFESQIDRFAGRGPHVHIEARRR